MNQIKRRADHRALKRCLCILLGTLLVPALALASTEAEGGGDHLGRLLPLWSIIPFIGILLSIAIFPLVAPSFWHHHFPKVSALWALIFLVPFLIIYKGDAFYEFVHIIVVDYIPFIVVLWGLFTVGSGIVLRGIATEISNIQKHHAPISKFPLAFSRVIQEFLGYTLGDMLAKDTHCTIPFLHRF